MTAGLLVIVLTQRPVADDDETCLASALTASLHALERIDQRGQPVARIEAAEEENRRDVFVHAWRRGHAWMKDVGVDAVGNDLPIGIEVPIERDGGAVRDGDGRGQHIE